VKRLLSLLLVLLPLAACGEKAEPTATGGGKLQKLTVVLDYFPNADHAPIYAAQASGEFRRAGLDVKLITPSDPSAPLRLLQAGRADLALTYEPELILARDKGINLVGVGALVQKPLTSLMAIDGAKVKSVGDLRGKTVGTAGIPYQSAYLKTILAQANVPAGSVKEVNVGFNLVPAMLSKKVDATLGAFWNYEGVDLRQRGKQPTILRMDQLGVPTYDELLFAARRTSLHHAEASRIRRFMVALQRGAEQVRDSPSTAVDALLKANDDLSEKLQTAAVQATTPAFFPTDSKRPFGFQDLTDWLDYGHWMRKHGLVTKDPHADDAVTNEFLPGQGLEANTAEPQGG
jgi:putative hydroxymethylpyrimidine transport system substrate-binding protein